MNFFNISALHTGGGARPSAPRRACPEGACPKGMPERACPKKYPKTRVFRAKTRKKDQKIGSFFDFFRRFFQFSSRTSGMNFDTIACVFELVDGQKNVSFFRLFSRKLFFQNILGGPIHSFPTLRSGQKNLWKFSFFPILSYPILPLLRA